MSQNVNFLHKILLRARYFFHNVWESNVSKLKGEGLRKRVSPPITMGSLFDVAAVSLLLTKEWSKFASEAEDRDLIGSKWGGCMRFSLFYPSWKPTYIYIYIYINIDTLQDAEGEMSRVSKKKNKRKNKYVINKKHTVKSERISQIK